MSKGVPAVGAGCSDLSPQEHKEMMGFLALFANTAPPTPPVVTQATTPNVCGHREIRGGENPLAHLPPPFCEIRSVKWVGGEHHGLAGDGTLVALLPNLVAESLRNHLLRGAG